MKNLTCSCVRSVIFHQISSAGHLFSFWEKRLRVKTPYRGTELQHQQCPPTKKAPLMLISFTLSLLSGLSQLFAASMANKPQAAQRIETEVSRRLYSSVHGKERSGKGTRPERFPTLGGS